MVTRPTLEKYSTSCPHGQAMGSYHCHNEKKNYYRDSTIILPGYIHINEVTSHYLN